MQFFLTCFFIIEHIVILAVVFEVDRLLWAFLLARNCDFQVSILIEHRIFVGILAHGRLREDVVEVGTLDALVLSCSALSLFWAI